MHDNKITKDMTDAVALYTGAVTHCPPGAARGRRIKQKNAAVQWLIEHRDEPRVVDPKAQRKRLRALPARWR